MNFDDNRSKGLGELNYHRQDGKKKVMDGVTSEEQGLLEEYELKINGTTEDVKDGSEREVHAKAVGQIPQQQSQGTMVCWERFLHIRTLKVLLVENDDSTRHVVTALLRNCSYEVIEAGNALQAWKILEDLTKHIDLVLTEVVMPCVSGLGLLCKIMSHKTRRNVPVIMMSSRGSMGLVFKCLSRGAVDFLVKPIRKNELKNLWQHVWRRCHSSSGSGSESGTQTQKSVRSKSVEKSDYNTGSNDEDDYGSIGLNIGGESDSGSGAQSSWTRPGVEIDSPRVVARCDHIAECPDSTCAQVIHSNTETTKRVPVTTMRKCQEQDDELENVAMGKDLEISAPVNLDLQLKHPIEFPIDVIGAKQNNLVETGFSILKEEIGKGQLDLNSGSPSRQLRHQAANLTGVVTNSPEFEAPNKLSKILDVNDNAITDKELPSLELSLKRLRGVEDIGTIMQDDRNVLRRSNLSAFSRYNTASNSNKAPSGNIGSVSPRDKCLEFMKNESVRDAQCHSNYNPLNQCSNGGSNNIDMGSTSNNVLTKPEIIKYKSEATSCLHLSSSLQPMKNDLMCASQQAILDRAAGIASITMLDQPKGIHQVLQIQHLHRHYDHHHHLVHGLQQQHLPPDNDGLTLKEMAAAASHCGSSNVLGRPLEGKTGNYSLNGSASGSNHGSSGQNGNSTAVNAGGTNMESDNAVAGKSGSGEASGGGSGNRVDQNKLAQREAALTKFRQKRMERCFRKKVRYQSRKRLAEQRPRVRGQFVRQTRNENSSSAADGQLNSFS